MNVVEMRLLHRCIMEQNFKPFSIGMCNVSIINWVDGDAQYQHLLLLQGMKVD
jgi:hypothetical protein